jgi:hypothetical protein
MATEKSEKGSEKLKEGLFIVKEGGNILVDIPSHRHGMTTIRITFPHRDPKYNLKNLILPL